MSTVVLEGTWARVRNPEGQTACLAVEEMVARLAGERMDTRDLVLPDGVKAVIGRGSVTVVAVQVPPRLHRLSWITDDSPSNHPGEGPLEVEYREVTLALPYVMVLAVFQKGSDGGWYLSNANECFFRNEPLESLEDRLLYPALLNVSKFEPPKGKPLAWICTQFLDRRQLGRQRDDNARIRRSLDVLLHTLFETGFNRSSEEHESTSWFTESRRVDRRIAKVERWEEASRRDPLFVLEIPWLDARHSLRQVADRIAANLEADKHAVRTSAGIARMVFHHGTVQNTLFS